MPNFSIVSVDDARDDRVTGHRIQGHIGTLETASDVANMYAAHSRLPVAVVDSDSGWHGEGYREFDRPCLYQVPGSL